MWLYPVPSLVALLGWIFIFATTPPTVVAFGLGALLLGAVWFRSVVGKGRTWPFEARRVEPDFMLALSLPRLLLLSSVVVPSSVLGQAERAIRSSLRTVEIPSGRVVTVFTDNRHFEAPNWSRDGRFFVVNSDGRLYRLAARGDKRLVEIPRDSLREPTTTTASHPMADNSC